MARREKWVKSAGPFFSEGIWKHNLRDPHSGSYLAAAISRVNCGCGSGDDQAVAQFFCGKMVGWDVQDDSTSEFAYRLFSVGGTLSSCGYSI